MTEKLARRELRFLVFGASAESLMTLDDSRTERGDSLRLSTTERLERRDLRLLVDVLLVEDPMLLTEGESARVRLVLRVLRLLEVDSTLLADGES